MGYFPVRYDSRVVINEHKMFIRLATDLNYAKHYTIMPRNYHTIKFAKVLKTHVPGST